jgi:hypothetical protein
MRATIMRRIAVLEHYVRENLVPVPEALRLLAGILAWCQAKEHEPWSATLAGAVEPCVSALRAGDVRTFYEKAEEATRTLAEPSPDLNSRFPARLER